MSATATKPYPVPDDDDDDDGPSNIDDGDLYDMFNIDCDNDVEITAFRSCMESSSASRKTISSEDVELPDISIQSFKLSKGNIIKPGDTVELRDHTNQPADAMHSGDFLRVKAIIMNLETDQIRLRGHRLRRTKYLGQIFNWKLNELGMVLNVDEGDHRSPLIAGMEDVDMKEVIRMRECTLTNKPFPLLSFRSYERVAYPVGMSEEEIKRQIFYGGQLACRVVKVFYIKPKTGKSYGGVARQLYVHEADTNQRDTSNDEAYGSTTVNNSINNTVHKKVPPTRKRSARSESPEVELLDSPLKRRASRSVRHGKFAFGDVFCGAGGASQGALQAGYSICWGLDFDHTALETYRLNHPTAHTFELDAHDFPPKNVCPKCWKVDVLHLSPPCCYWSPAHTQAGPNDQANYESIYTVGPILKKVRPRIATLEQTSGLATSQEHKRNFFMLLHDICEAGYDVRYRIQDLSQLGLVQKRMRLLIIAARRGTPLPPFPKPTHGPEGSGLKPFVNIEEALRDIARHPNRSMNDLHHQPKLFTMPKPRYSSYSQLKGCITTGGTTSYHPSGLRNFTARELALLQSFPVRYRFAGSTGQVKKQAGNAYPPITSEAIYREIAMTLDAFDGGLIDAEDDLSNLNLDALLRANDLSIRNDPRHMRNEFNEGFDLENPRLRTTPSDTDEVIDLLDDEHDEEYVELLGADDEDGFIDLLDADDEDESIGLLDDDDDEGRNQDEDDDEIVYLGTRESNGYF
ncbi:C-5 cytosine methyltransferase DmtA [Pyrenophora tritici-repentis]|nr:C-5 cytosine methyltransferase DmtA [Pyrenophora tritici-repentis]